MTRLTPRSASFLLRLASMVIVSTGALPCVADPRGAGAAPGSSDQLRLELIKASAMEKTTAAICRTLEARQVPRSGVIGVSPPALIDCQRPSTCIVAPRRHKSHMALLNA